MHHIFIPAVSFVLVLSLICSSLNHYFCFLFVRKSCIGSYFISIIFNLCVNILFFLLVEFFICWCNYFFEQFLCESFFFYVLQKCRFHYRFLLPSSFIFLRFMIDHLISIHFFYYFVSCPFILFEIALFEFNI